jgi:glycosyltransferase involved in cell wall biosynthesis
VPLRPVGRSATTDYDGAGGIMQADRNPSLEQTREPETLPLELSVVMPCLNEAETLPECVDKVRRVFREHRIAGEIVVADNGSSDGSDAIATQMGARLVRVKDKGYGNALRGGIAAACGKYVITVDADNSHDFAQIPVFLAKLRGGYDLVVGNRFRGQIHSGAMPALHRYLGSPVLTRLGKLLFRSPCGDQQCGFRAFSRAVFTRMRLRATGMEFASEMVLKAVYLRMRIAEVPTTQFPAGRHRPPHLRTWRDGWRHLRLMLLHSPRWLFFYPGVLLVALGLLVGLWLMPGPRVVKGVVFDIHTLLYAATAVLLGFQSITFAAFTKIYAIREGLLPEDRRLEKLLRVASLELGLAVGGLLVVAGLAASVYAVENWGSQHFGDLDPVKAMRFIIPAVFALTLGGQIMLSSFFLSVLLLGRAPQPGEAPDVRLE